MSFTWLSGTFQISIKSYLRDGCWKCFDHMENIWLCKCFCFFFCVGTLTCSALWLTKPVWWLMEHRGIDVCFFYILTLHNACYFLKWSHKRLWVWMCIVIYSVNDSDLLHSTVSEQAVNFFVSLTASQLFLESFCNESKESDGQGCKWWDVISFICITRNKITMWITPHTAGIWL